MDTQEKEEIAKDIPIGYEFKDVFLEELSGLSLQREIDFKIELIFSDQSISRALYDMVLIGLEN